MDKVKSLVMFAAKVWLALVIINVIKGFLPDNIKNFIDNPLQK